jgi:hypothetical protein
MRLGFDARFQVLDDIGHAVCPMESGVAEGYGQLDGVLRELQSG